MDWRSTYEEGDFKDLAAYICKQPERDSQEYEQLSLFPKEEQKELLSYSSSRNLIRPEPERKRYSHRTVRKLIQDGPKPTPGYYIDLESLYIGTNPYTGYSYCKYIEIKLPENRIKSTLKKRIHPLRGDDALWT